ncbi:MAG: hypothetical protein RDV48_26710 [Candidatus Eremiobacteraeota bacterium]|nr:hypothetical protein [Candidatus Eremiobacteraeota bacterium]
MSHFQLAFNPGFSGRGLCKLKGDEILLPLLFKNLVYQAPRDIGQRADKAGRRRQTGRSLGGKLSLGPYDYRLEGSREKSIPVE